MAQPKQPPPTLLFAAVFSRYDEVFDWASERIASTWGKIGLTSPKFDHSETQYYADEMGPGLSKQFLVLESFFDPAQLATTKLVSNTWESELAENPRYPVLRPLNVDPGYLTLTKVVLASAKDRAHRIYLRDGIYAEECLYYLGKGWQSRDWTYPDYQRDDFRAFFESAREYLKQKIQNNTSGD